MLRRLWQWLVQLLSGTPAPSPEKLDVVVARPPAQPMPVVAPPLATTPRPPPAPVPAEPPFPPLYRPKEFNCVQVLEKSKPDVMPEGQGRRQPTPAQRLLIYTDAGAQAVVAGAGSGKSTSLVARLLLMNKHLGVPLKHLSVFTFTRNSRYDFIGKLVKEAALWNVKMTEEAATERVRTFHSKVLELSRGALPPGTQIFDMLGKKPKPKPGSAEEQNFLEEQEKLADELENPFDNSRSSQQLQIQRDVYTSVYNNSAKFRDAVAVLLRFAFKSQLSNARGAATDWEKRTSSAARDAALTTHAEAFWRKRGSWPVNGIEPPPRALTVEGMVFRASGYVPGVDVFIVLGCPDSEKAIVDEGAQRFSPYWSACSKHAVLLRGCSETVFFANEANDFALLASLLVAATDQAALKAPTFNLQLAGEVSATPIFEALFDIGAFAENLGMQPQLLSSRLKLPPTSAVERAAAVATSELYKGFRDYCGSNGMRTFNELFLAFAPGSPQLQDVDLAELRSMKHLLIDEFQDISPLIVQFVQGLHEELHRRTSRQEHPTLLAVGDDWQSIYGWRGSAPRFFLKFATFFEGAVKKPLELTDNFRSSQRIIDAASFPIAETSRAHRLDKICKALNKHVAELDIPVWLIEDKEKVVLADLPDLIERLMTMLGEKESVLVLSRGNATDKKAKAACAQWKQDKRLRCMTIHKSKGLEATYVIVLGDTGYVNENPLRNAMYAAAGFEQTYDQAQTDEAMRLAYVAITRAERMCIWMGTPREGAAMNTLPSSSRSVRRADIGQLNRYLDGVPA